MGSSVSHDPIVGIDFGTSISAVAVHGPRGPELIPNDLGETSTPSAVAFGTEGNILVGQPAVDYLMRRPERGVLEVKRLFGYDVAREFEGNPLLVVDGVAYTPVHLAAFILRKLGQDATLSLQREVNSAVLTAPAYFDQSQFNALMEAAQLAGFYVMRVVPEPVAASMGVNWDPPDWERWLVYDLGGGTFDASVVEGGEGVLEVQAVSGDTRLGGADFDRILVDYCVEAFKNSTAIDLSSDAAALMRLRDAAERAKIELSTARASSICVPFLAFADSKPLHFELEVTRTRYNELTCSLVTKTLDLSIMALEDAGESPATIGRVLVVGRAARAASVDQALSDLFNGRIQRAPDHVVALGAAVEGGILSGRCKDRLLLDTVSHSLRVEVADGRSTPIIVRNTVIPTRRSEHLTASGAGGRLPLKILAGESSWADKNLLLAECEVVMPGEHRQVELVLDIDANSSLGIAVRDCATDEDVFRKKVELRRENRGWLVNQSQKGPPGRWATSCRLAPSQRFPKARPLTIDTVARWVAFTAAEFVLSTVGPTASQGWWLRLWEWLVAHRGEPAAPEFTIEVVFDVFSLQRELLIDILEQETGVSLDHARYSGSIRSLTEKLVTTLNGAWKNTEPIKQSQL